MKKKKRLFILFLILSIALTPTISACLESADAYAVEVVLNKPGIDYNLNSLVNAKNVIFKGNEYRFLSDYEEDLLVIISDVDEGDTTGIKGLSIRIQIPTKIGKEKIKYLNFISRSVNGKINSEFINKNFKFERWDISCSKKIGRRGEFNECKFNKGNINLRAFNRESKGGADAEKYDVEVEILGNISTCSSDSNNKGSSEGCDGHCIRSGGQSACIDSVKKKDIENILKHTGLIRNFKELMKTYNVIENSVISLLTTKPSEEILGRGIMWESAMRKQLAWLKRNDIIRLTNSDINEISYLSKMGAAGENNRIVYAKGRDGIRRWVYYKDSLEPVITLEKKCGEFIISPSITGGVVFDSQNVSAYYVVPIVLTAIPLLLILIAILFVRLMHEKKRREELEKEKAKYA